MQALVHIALALVALFASSAHALYGGRGSAVVEATDKTFKNEVLQHPGVVIVEFYAPWCGHCKALAPEYAAAAKELKARLPSVVLANVDGTVETALPQRYGAKGFPHLVWFADGSPSEYTGGRTRAEIVSWVRPPPAALRASLAPGQRQGAPRARAAVKRGGGGRFPSRPAVRLRARRLRAAPLWALGRAPRRGERGGVRGRACARAE
jgi:protein disulfide-isomerase-like protein